MKIKNNQKGFGIIEVLLVIIIVGLIGGAAYYVYNSKQAKNDETQLSIKPKDMEVKTSEGKTFKFNEMGVKIVLTKDIEHLKYKVYPVTSTNNNEVYSVTTTDIESLHDKCDKLKNTKTDQEDIRTISRHTGDYQKSYDEWAKAPETPSFPKLLKQFSGYYISAYERTDYEFTQCIGTKYDKQYQDMYEAADKALFTAFKDAEQISN